MIDYLPLHLRLIIFIIELRDGESFGSHFLLYSFHFITLLNDGRPVCNTAISHLHIHTMWRRSKVGTISALRIASSEQRAKHTPADPWTDILSL